jgi:hypothetical protein
MAHAALNEVCMHPAPDLTTALERLPQAATLTALVVAAWLFGTFGSPSQAQLAAAPRSSDQAQEQQPAACPPCA